MSARTCMTGCGKPLGRANVSGRCRPCFIAHLNSDPELRERARQNMRAALARPESRARRSAISRRQMRERLKDPTALAAAREAGRRLGLSGVGHAVRPAGSETRIRAGRKSAETRLAWCPPEHRALYRELVHQRGVRGDEAKRMVLEHAAAEERRAAPLDDPKLMRTATWRLGQACAALLSREGALA